MKKENVLFVCIHNSARSQMSEAFLNQRCGDRFCAHSAGLEPGKLNPIVVEAMRLAGIDISGHQTKDVFSQVKSGKIFAYVITVCDEASAERCPIFPGVTKRLEWFAIEYTGRFWIEKPGLYGFALTSDDGSRLYIDELPIIDNDGLHAPLTKSGIVELSGGIHSIRLQYFQGPRFNVALVLEVAIPHEQLRVFSTDEFKPPANPEDWKFPNR